MGLYHLYIYGVFFLIIVLQNTYKTPTGYGLFKSPGLL